MENGVGMLRNFKTTLLEAIELLKNPPQAVPFSIATGTAAAPFLQNLLGTITEKYGKMDGSVYAVENKFFGPSINVAGLITGGDIAEQLKGRNLGQRLLIPQTMLRSGEEIFLDDYTVEKLSAELGVPVIPVKPEGESLLQAIFFEV